VRHVTTASPTSQQSASERAEAQGPTAVEGDASVSAGRGVGRTRRAGARPPATPPQRRPGGPPGKARRACEPGTWRWAGAEGRAGSAATGDTGGERGEPSGDADTPQAVAVGVSDRTTSVSELLRVIHTYNCNVRAPTVPSPPNEFAGRPASREPGKRRPLQRRRERPSERPTARARAGV
jgi:hypothetical protein